jgi:hypothetical protein
MQTKKKIKVSDDFEEEIFNDDSWSRRGSAQSKRIINEPERDGEVTSRRAGKKKKKRKSKVEK